MVFNFSKLKNIIIFIYVVIILISRDIKAQNFNYAVLDKKNIIHLLGYSRISESLKNPLIFTSDIILAFSLYQGKLNKTYVIGIVPGVQYLILNRNYWKISTILNFYNSYTNTNHFSFFSYGNNLKLINGFYTQTWFGAVELGSFFPVVSKIKFKSEEYRDLYNNPNDGWYYFGDILLNFGALVGYTIKKRTDVILNVGRTLNLNIENSNAYYYYRIDINYRFPKVLAESKNDKKLKRIN